MISQRRVLGVALLFAPLWISGCWGRNNEGLSVATTTVTQPSLGHQPTTQAQPQGPGSTQKNVPTSGLGTQTPGAQTPGEGAKTTTSGNPEAGNSGQDDSSNPQPGPQKPEGYPDISACTFPTPGVGSRVVLTSTDFSTGAVGWIDVKTRQVYPDLGLASTDTRLKHSDKYHFLINRFGFDSITIMAKDDKLTWLGEFSVKGTESTSSNPHDLVIDDKGHLHLSFLGRDHLEVYDISDPKNAKLLREIDISAFADADGLPESSFIIPCGDTYFVEIQRLDRKKGWTPVDHTYLVPIHAPTGTFYDFDGSKDGAGDGIRITGTGMSSWRGDPRFSDNTHILALNRGVQSIDLKTAAISQVIPEQVFIDLGMEIWDVRNFEVSPDGRWIWILAIDGWPKHTIFRASFDQQGRDLTPVIKGVESVDASMIRVGNSLWLADTTDGASGVRIFDFVGDSLQESKDGPIRVGLPPYWLHLVP